MKEDDELLQVFREEVGAQLEELDALLGEPPSGWDLGHAFHLAHNVKGAGRMIGAGAFAEVAHAVEDLFGELRARGRVTRSLVSLARDGLTLLHACFDGFERGAQPDVTAYTARVRRSLARAAPPPVEPEAGPAAPELSEPAVDVVAVPAGASSTMRISVEKLQVVMELGAEMMTGLHRAEQRRALAGQVVRELDELRRKSPALARDELLLRSLASARELWRELDRDRVRKQQLSERLQDAIRQLRLVRVDTLRGALSRAAQRAAEARGRPSSSASRVPTRRSTAPSSSASAIRSCTSSATPSRTASRTRGPGPPPASRPARS
ncbi:MAG: Hpt domain-containing protein [Sandaracinaceae bacterium]|nr:Hpt domain-containing protein [Sandaracinaceae bacterium]